MPTTTGIQVGVRATMLARVLSTRWHREANPTGMLTDEQKAAIRAEEVFREEVRAELVRAASEPTARARLWSALNSSFFLWCMSSIVLGIASFAYQQRTESQKERATRQEAVRRLDAELASRLAFFRDQLLHDIPQATALKQLNNPSGAEFASGVFPEYGNRPVRALLWDLHSFVPDAEKLDIETALKRCDDLAKLHFLTGADERLVQTVHVDVNVKVRNVKVDAALNDFFADLDKKAAETPLPKAAVPASVPAERVPAVVATPANAGPLDPGRIGGATASGATNVAIDINLKGDAANEGTPLGSNVSFTTHVIQETHPVIKSFNLKRWHSPFAGLAGNFLENLRARDPNTFALLQDATNRVGAAPR